MKIDNLDEKLIKAVEKGNLGTAFEMLKRGANPDADKGMPLYLAIKQKNANMIQLLLNSGANIIESSERLQTLQNDKNYQKNKNEINLLKLYKEKNITSKKIYMYVQSVVLLNISLVLDFVLNVKKRFYRKIIWRYIL